jgi:hypothetical protein
MNPRLPFAANAAEQWKWRLPHFGEHEEKAEAYLYQGNRF